MTDRISGISGPWAYGLSWQWTLFVAVMISWGMMNVIAILLEHRTLLDPRGQYKAFWFGDLICLPGLVLTLRYLSQYVSARSHFWQNPGWHMTCLVVGVVAGAIFHRMEAGGGIYSTAQMYSPTKLYLDLVAIPAFVYVLLSAAPVLFWANNPTGTHAVLVAQLLGAGLIASFVALLVYDLNHPGEKAHIDLDIRERFRPKK